MSRRKHSKKEVEEAVAYAESKGWRIELGGSHVWGKMYCPYRNLCTTTVLANTSLKIDSKCSFMTYKLRYLICFCLFLA